MSRSRLSISLLVVGMAFVPCDGFSQFVEVPPGPSARRLPAELYERVRQDPTELFRMGGWAARAERSVAAGQAVEGDLALVAVTALFSDSPDPTISAADLHVTLFTGPESLRDFYAEASGNRLNITGEVTDWVRTSLTLAEVAGSNYGMGEDNRIGEYLVDALTQVDPSVDFGLYDNDGPDNIPNSGDDNGVVDAITFYFLEVAASCGGAGIWPHFWGITPLTGAPFETDDEQPDGSPISINQFFIQSIVDCSGTGITPISAVAHEMGHLLGLPDLYHAVDGLLPEERRWVVGCWSLMAAGAWGCGPVDDPSPWLRPTHPGAWEKRRLGWVRAIRLVFDTENLDISLPPVQTDRVVLEVPLSDHERLFLEYRDKIGFDRDLPAAGVLVYAINDTLPERPCPTCVPVYRVRLLEADGDSMLLKTYPQGGSRGEPGDAYGVLGPGELTGLSEPSTRSNSGLGAETDVNLYSIVLEDGFAHIIVSTTPISTPRLLGPLLLDEANGLTALEEDYLDRLNNGNGRYDVGDLRAYLLRRRGHQAQRHVFHLPLPRERALLQSRW